MLTKMEVDHKLRNGLLNVLLNIMQQYWSILV